MFCTVDTLINGGTGSAHEEISSDSLAIDVARHIGKTVLVDAGLEGYTAASKGHPFQDRDTRVTYRYLSRYEADVKQS